MPIGHPEVDLFRTILENPRPMLTFLKQMMYYFRNNAKHKDFLGKVLMCRVKHQQGCMDQFERIDKLIIKNENANRPKLAELLSAVRRFYLERTPGPIVRDANFCQEILHERPQCRNSSVSMEYGSYTDRYEGYQTPKSEELVRALQEWPAEAERMRRAGPGRQFRDCEECPLMVEVPAGWFVMGSPQLEGGGDERPQHRVTIGERFAVGAYEVTFAEWEACVSGGGCGGQRPDDEGWGRGDRPVINVNWEEAQAYVRWLSWKTGEEYRLPSESEWEYVARAGTTTPFHTGKTITTDQANYRGSRTERVGTYGANAFGLHDVHGNVFEWVQDCWNDSYEGAPADGSAWERDDCSHYDRVLRGGSWYYDSWTFRSASRDTNWGIDDSLVGFRVARTLVP